MQIHREGKKIVYGAWILFFLVGISLWRLGGVMAIWWSVPIGLIALFVSRFFRVPDRNTCLSVNHLVAPADGKIVGVEKITFNDTPYIMISIFMSIWNIHINWAPLTGKIRDKKYFPGKFLMAIQPKASELNERSQTIISGAHGDIVVTQVAGAVARRISTYPNIDDDICQGDELGFIKFGSRVDILMPTKYVPVVSNGQKVTGLDTVIAHIECRVGSTE